MVAELPFGIMMGLVVAGLLAYMLTQRDQLPKGVRGYSLILAGLGFLLIGAGIEVFAPDLGPVRMVGRFGAGIAGGVLLAWGVSVWIRSVVEMDRRLSHLESVERDRDRAIRGERDSQRMLQLILDAIPIRVFWKDRNLRYIGCNRLFAEDAGYGGHDEIVGKDDFELHWIDEAESYRADDRTIIETGLARFGFEESQTGRDGRRRWLRTSKVPLPGPDGTVIGVLGCYEDITKQKNVARALEESEAQLRTVLESASIGVGIEHLDGRTVRANPVLCGFLGYTSEELCALHFTEYTHPEDAALDAAMFDEIVVGSRTSYQLEKRYIRKDGTIAWGRVTRSLFRDADGDPKYVLGMFQDITDRVRAEAALKESEARFRALANAAPMAITIKGLDRRFQWANAEFLGWCGMSLETLRGRSTADLQPPDITEQITRLEDISLQTGNPQVRQLESTLNGVARTELTVRFPIVDDDGIAIGIGGVGIDISEQRSIEHQLLQAQKMEAVGLLASGIAHDFNNLLQVIETNLELASIQLAGGQDPAESLDRAKAAGRRGGRLTQQLLRYSRKQNAQNRRVEPNALVERVVEMLGRTLGEKILLQTRLDPDAGIVFVDENRLENAVLNLAINSKAAMPDGGTLVVTTGNCRLGPEDIINGEPARIGDYVEIAVADNGCGMSEDVLAHAFEPFYTTKEVGVGSGLGLSMVNGFARQSGGYVVLRSTPGQGTRVSILLPESSTGDAASAAEGTMVSAGEFAGKILLVEDDAAVRVSTAQLLASFGFEVIEADRASSALDILAREPDIALLITDMVMSAGMNGVQLASRARADNAALKVVIVSGYPRSEIDRITPSEGGFQWLPKPFTISELMEILGSVLDR